MPQEAHRSANIMYYTLRQYLAENEKQQQRNDTNIHMSNAVYIFEKARMVLS